MTEERGSTVPAEKEIATVLNRLLEHSEVLKLDTENLLESLKLILPEQPNVTAKGEDTSKYMSPLARELEIVYHRICAAKGIIRMITEENQL